MTFKQFWSALIVATVLALIISSYALSAQEDTAQLTFTKTAIAKKPLYTYTVQKGDVLSAVIRRIPGITEKEIPVYYRMIKELNPEIENLNKLQTGQEIVLPGKPVGTPDSASEPAAAQASSSKATGTTDTTGSFNYQVKRGDSLIRIVHRELSIPSGTQPVLLNIKTLNPSLKNIHKIYAGQVIRLPDIKNAGKTELAKTKAETAVVVKTDEKPVRDDKLSTKDEKPIRQLKVVDETRLPKLQDEKKSEPPKTDDGKEALVLTPTQRLTVVKHIIGQMNGSMMTSGNYYLPVSKTEQLTIDCSIIPVVELDGQTIYLDQGDRSNAQLKKMINDRWNNHHLIKIDPKDDILVVLKKILTNTKAYEISKAQKPLMAGSQPPLEIVVDWVISKKAVKPSATSASYGIRFVYDANSVLPRAVVNYARKHAVFVTEISPEKGLVEKPEELYSLPPATVLPATSAKDFAASLLSYVNIAAEKDVDVRVFNIEKDGFNLSIKADLIVDRNGKKHIILSRDLPPQFVNILTKAGNELVFISDQEGLSKTMETVLQAFKIASVSGYFTFSGVDKNQPPYSFGFNGTKIKTDKDTYVVNFNFNDDLRGLLKEAWSANIIRY